MHSINKSTRARVMGVLFRDVLLPLFLGPYYVLKGIYWILFGWWLDPWWQRRANHALMDDVQANLYFLYSRGQPIEEKRPRSLPFDYASVRIAFENIYFTFTRGRGELNVTLAPRHAPTDGHELTLVVAALDSSDLRPVGDFPGIAAVLRPRLRALNEAFSESRYPEFEKKLP